MYFNNLEDVKQYADEIICFYSDNDPYVKYEVEKDFADKIATEQVLIPNAGKQVFTHCLYTLKDKPSRINKRTKILSRFDVKIHRVNWLNPAILR